MQSLCTPKTARQTFNRRHRSTNIVCFQVGDEKPPPPSPAADTGSSGVAPGFTVTSADEEDHGEASTTEVGMDGSVDPTYGSGSSRASAGDKYGRPNDHPHLAYIYRGRGTATREDESGGFSSGGGDGKAAVGEEKPQDQVTPHRRARVKCRRISERGAEGVLGGGGARERNDGGRTVKNVMRMDAASEMVVPSRLRDGFP